MIEGTLPVARETLFWRALVPPDAQAYLAIVHGYGDHGGRYEGFMVWLAERGIASYAIDLRGQGKSTGRAGFVRQWDDYLEDLNAFLAMDALQPGARSQTPLFLLGHSHGALVLAAAAIRGMLHGVRGCILSAPFFRNRMVIPKSKLLLARLANPIVPWLAVKTGLGDTMMTSDAAMREESRRDSLICRVATPRWFIGQLAAQREVMARAAEFRLPLLTLAGDADPIADYTAAIEFYERAGSTDKALQVYPGLLHELLRETDRERIYADIHQWLGQHIGR